MDLLQRPSRSAIACLVVFGMVSLLVAFHLTQAWDVAVLAHIGGWRTDPRTDWMTLGTVLGGGEIEVPFAFGVALLLWVMGRADRGKRLVCAGLTAELVYVVLKPIFHRPRPTVLTHLAGAGWYSYPSGHSMLAPIVWGLGCLLLARTVKSDLLRIPLLVLALVMPIWIAVSRIYLGVHYPSDVLGALALGIGWVLLWREPRESAAEASSEPATR
jgi:undecaprenyl-diphosphatase